MHPSNITEPHINVFMDFARGQPFYAAKNPHPPCKYSSALLLALCVDGQQSANEQVLPQQYAKD